MASIEGPVEGRPAWLKSVFTMHALDQAWDTIRRDFDAACSQVARAARCQITNELNQCLRRLRRYQTEGEWVSAVLDTTSRFVQQIAIFALNDGVLTLRGQHKLNLPEKLTFAVGAAGAFASAIETKDPVVALRIPSEVTEALSVSEAEERAHVFPISNGNRVVAILFAADQDYMDVNALEVIAGLASAVLERRSNTSLHAQIASAAASPEEETPAARVAAPEKTRNGAIPVVPATAPLPAAVSAKSELPQWADLSEQQRSLHISAQRFSRVTVAEMQLARPGACRIGRQQRDLYMFLKREIDAARETYRKQFMTIPSMVDYLHLELVRTAAEGDELKLGAEYPGRLV